MANTATPTPTPTVAPQLVVSVAVNKPVISLGEIAWFTVTMKNAGTAPCQPFDLRNFFPPGFKYVGSTGVVDGVPMEPSLEAGQAIWKGFVLAPGQVKILIFAVVAGTGAYPGSYPDLAYATDAATGIRISNQAEVRVRVDAEPLFAQSWILGKVFYDINGDGIQQEGEQGIAGARIATLGGLWAETDAQGRYHIADVDVPNRQRGTSFMAKLDPASLPAGSELTSENPRLIRVTGGLLEKINFGVRCPQCCQRSVLRLRVMFNACDDSLTAEGQIALKAFADGMAKGGRSSLKLQGEARCPEALGGGLARRRVDAVRAALKKLGLEAQDGKLDVQVQGEKLGASEEMRRQRWVLRPHFDSGRAELKPSDLEKIAAVAAEVSGRVGAIQVFGHTDDESLAFGTRAQFSDNQGLSEARAKAVALALGAKLGERGIDLPLNADVRGFADSQPVANNNVRQGMRLNRRVEVNVESYLPTQGHGVWMDAELEVSKSEMAPGERLRPCGCWIGSGNSETMRLPLSLAACETEPSASEAARLAPDLAHLSPGSELMLRLSLDPSEHPAMPVKFQTLVLRPQFGSGSAELSPASAEEIRAEAHSFKGLARSISAEGHTDSQALAAQARARYKNNAGLSEARAKAVLDVFVGALVAEGRPLPLRLATRGFGDAHPLGPNNQEYGRSQNRRVELVMEVSDQPATPRCGDDLALRRSEGIKAWVNSQLPEAAKGQVEIQIEESVPEASKPAEKPAPSPVPSPAPSATPPAGAGLRLPSWLRLFSLILGGPAHAAEASVMTETTAPCVSHRVDPLRSEPKLSAALSDNPLWLPPAGPEIETVEEEVPEALSGSAGVVTRFTLRPQFASGTDDLDPDSVGMIEDAAHSLSGSVLSLSFVGHTDHEPLAPSTAERFGDNFGLSRSRAAAVGAVFLKALPPELRPKRELVKIEGKGASEPLVPNRTLQAMAQNRRVEVEVVGLAGQASSEVVMVKRSVTRTAKPRAAHFLLHCNYPGYVSELSLKIWDKQSLEPIRILKAPGSALNASLDWDLKDSRGARILPGAGYRYVLEVRDAQGRLDSTRERYFEVRDLTLLESKPAEKELKPQGGREVRRDEAGLGGNRGWDFDADNTGVRNIPLTGATVTFLGQDLLPNSAVRLAGETAFTDGEGRFVRERILPPGKHAFSYAGLRTDGQPTSGGATIDVPDNGYFLIALAETTIGYGLNNGDPGLLQDENSYPDKLYADGRAAFYYKGKMKGKYLLSAQADTGEERVDRLFQRMDQKDPRQVFRRLDPDRYYPVYGDGSNTRMDVDTQGKFYVRLDSDEWNALWGNYATDLRGGELAGYQRALYGARVAWASPQAKAEGERRMEATLFGAEALSAHGHDELRSTGGLLYYLSSADLVVGSERLRIEARDPLSGRVTFSAPLEPGKDYQLDWLQGRVTLERDLRSSLPSQGLATNLPGSGDAMSLVVDYEYAPRFENQIEQGSVGGRVAGWILPQLKLGLTGVHEGRAQPESYGLVGLDAEFNPLKGISLKAELAGSQRQQGGANFSADGGLSYQPLPDADLMKTALANKVALTADLQPWLALPLRLDADAGAREAGFSSNGMRSPAGRQDAGISLQAGNSGGLLGSFRGRQSVELGYSRVNTESVGLEAPLAPGLRASGELRQTEIGDAGYTDLRDTLAAVRLDYALGSLFNVYAGGQVSLLRGDGTPENNSATLGFGVQLSRALRADLGGSYGSLGSSLRLGLNGTVNEALQSYGSLERRQDPYSGTGFSSIVGTRWSASERWKTYAENQFNLGDLEQGRTQLFGLSYQPAPALSLGADYSQSRLNRQASDPALRYIDRVLRSDGLTAGAWASGPVQVDRDVVSASLNYALASLHFNNKAEFRADRGGLATDQWVLSHFLDFDLRHDLSLMGKLNLSRSYDLLGGQPSAWYNESGLGLAWRPADPDILNLVAKFTYLEELSPLQQLSGSSVDQRSAVAALEGVVELGARFEFLQKLAFKRSSLRLARNSGDWLQSDTSLSVSRLNYHLIFKLDAYLEYRSLWNTLAQDALRGWLIGFSYHIHEHLQVGAGYNFTDYNDDLVHFNTRSQGPFINVQGKW